MTLYVTLAVGCDEPDCFHEHEGFAGQVAAVVRRQARESGWTRVDGNDYCPLHRPTVEPEEDRHGK